MTSNETILTTRVSVGDNVTISYPEHRLRIMAYTYYITPPISLLSSCLLLYAVVKGYNQWKRKLAPTFVRLLAGFAIMDIIHSTGSIIFGPWSVPSDVDYVWNASGNIATCNANAFFSNMIWGLSLYSAFLALYHLLTIRFSWRKDFIASRVEPILHCFIWVLTVTTGIVLISIGYMNPVPGVPGYCWINDYPADCSLESDLECERGEGYYKISVVLGSGMGLSAFFVILLSFGLIYCKVRETEKKLARRNSGINLETSATAMELTAKVGRRAMAYNLAFLLCYTPIFAAQLGPWYYEENASTFYFWTTISFNILVPLQGFFHAWIFFATNPFFIPEDGPLYWIRFIPCKNNLDSSNKTNGSTAALQLQKDANDNEETGQVDGGTDRNSTKRTDIDESPIESCLEVPSSGNDSFLDLSRRCRASAIAA